MASRMKRIFHRKKEEDNSTFYNRTSNAAASDPTLRTSLYDSAVSGGLPQTGEYPIKGNDNLQQQGRKSSLRSRRSIGSHHYRSPSPDQTESQGTRAMAAPPPSDIVNPDLQASRKQRSPIPTSAQNEQKRRSRGHLSDDFSTLSLGNSG